MRGPARRLQSLILPAGFPSSGCRCPRLRYRPVESLNAIFRARNPPPGLPRAWKKQAAYAAQASPPAILRHIPDGRPAEDAQKDPLARMLSYAQATFRIRALSAPAASLRGATSRSETL